MSCNLGVGGNVPKNVIVTEDGKTYKKAGKAKSTGAVIAAPVAGGAVLVGGQALCRKPFLATLEKLNPETNDVYKNIVDDAFKKSGLSDKGVKLIDANEANSRKVASAINKCIPKWLRKIAVKNPQLKPGIDSVIDSMAGAVVGGKNAFFAPKANIIAVNKDKMSIAAFHEMGHAMNKHIGTFGKVLAKSRQPFMILTSLALLAALFKRKKAEGEEPKGLFDKATTFIKNNCGKLAFIGFLPTVLEEGLASLRGSKLAKGLINPEQLKTLNKFQGKAWLTYAGTAVATGLAAYVIKTVRDGIAHPKEINLKPQAE